MTTGRVSAQLGPPSFCCCSAPPSPTVPWVEAHETAAHGAEAHGVMGDGIMGGGMGDGMGGVMGSSRMGHTVLTTALL